MSKKADYFQFRFEPEFRERVNNMINESYADNFSDAIRKFADLGMEIYKIPKKNKTIVEKITKELKIYDGEYNDSTLKQIIEDLMIREKKWDSLKYLSDYQLYKLTKVLLNELLNKGWASHLKDKILTLDRSLDQQNENLERNLEMFHYENKEEVKESKYYNFGALDELKNETKNETFKESEIIRKSSAGNSIEGKVR